MFNRNYFRKNNWNIFFSYFNFSKNISNIFSTTFVSLFFFYSSTDILNFNLGFTVRNIYPFTIIFFITFTSLLVIHIFTLPPIFFLVVGSSRAATSDKTLSTIVITYNIFVFSIVNSVFFSNKIEGKTCIFFKFRHFF